MRLRPWIAVALIGALVFAACRPQPTTPVVSPAPGAATADALTPRPGGVLTFVVSAEPPSFDGHKETSFALLHPVAPHYSLLYKFDHNELTKIIPDVAAALPEISSDKLTWTIKLRTDVKFHDGATVMTSEDVLATYDKIIFPPTGVSSARKGTYAAVESISAPTKDTIVFKLKYPSASFLAGLASPWNFIYSAAKLKENIKFYETNVFGTGPFQFASYQKGAFWAGRKSPHYFRQGLPYLDGYRAIFITDGAAQVNAIKSEQALIEFRGFTPQQRDDISRTLGNKMALQEAPWICTLYIAINNQKKPFDDVRVRRALTLALDRWGGGEALSRITIVKDVGGLMRPKGPFAMSDADLAKIAGFGRDAKAAKDEARKLLKDAGQENLSFRLLNRNIPTPYEPMAIWMIDNWKQVGITVKHEVKETSPWLADLRTGNYDVGIDFNCDFLDEPDLQLAKFLSASKGGKGYNYALYDDSKLDGLIDAQSRETDPEKRKRLVWEIERYVLDEKAYQFPAIWWYRIIASNAKVRGWKVGSNHYTNQDLTYVWLAN